MSSWRRPLAERFPRLVEALAPIELADLPTPARPLEELGRRVGHSALFLKQDDLTSRLYGGNKARKLEFLLGEARRRGAATLVTMGGSGSNHLLATALHGRSLGLRTVGVVFPQPENQKVRANRAADHGAGVELLCAPSKYLLPVYVAGAVAMVRLREGRAPLLITGGGSSPAGVLGFINAALELAAQVRSGLLPEPEAVFVPCGTGGTAAGLSLGLQLCGLRSRVVAVRVIDRLLANRLRLTLLLRATARCLNRYGDRAARPASIGANLEMEHGYLGPGYGHPTPKAREAVALFRELEGVSLETTYTGKAAAAFLDRARSGGGPLLFWNTYSSADLRQWIRKGERR